MLFYEKSIPTEGRELDRGAHTWREEERNNLKPEHMDKGGVSVSYYMGVWDWGVERKHTIKELFSKYRKNNCFYYPYHEGTGMLFKAAEKLEKREAERKHHRITRWVAYAALTLAAMSVAVNLLLPSLAESQTITINHKGTRYFIGTPAKEILFDMKKAEAGVLKNEQDFGGEPFHAYAAYQNTIVNESGVRELAIQCVFKAHRKMTTPVMADLAIMHLDIKLNTIGRMLSFPIYIKDELPVNELKTYQFNIPGTTLISLAGTTELRPLSDHSLLLNYPNKFAWMFYPISYRGCPW